MGRFHATVNGNIPFTIEEEIEADKAEKEPQKIMVPQTITKLQAMKQMKAIGKWEAFKAILASNEDLNDEWGLSLNLDRSYPLVIGVAQLFEFTDVDMDNFFIAASKLS